MRAFAYRGDNGKWRVYHNGNVSHVSGEAVARATVSMLNASANTNGQSMPIRAYKF